MCANTSSTKLLCHYYILYADFDMCTLLYQVFLLKPDHNRSDCTVQYWEMFTFPLKFATNTNILKKKNEREKCILNEIKMNK